MLRIVVGAVGAGKTQKALHLITETAREKRFARIWVLLATRRQEQDFRQRLIESTDGEKFYFNIEFFNFYDLYQRLLNLSQTPAWRISAASRYGLLRNVINTLAESGELELYADVAQMPGFVRVVASLIDELKQNRVDPQLYAGMALTRKDAELAAIYQLYQNTLIENNLFDRDGEGWEALDLVDELNEIARDVDLLVVDGYDQFTRVQSELLLRLSERVDETFVTLPTAPDREHTIGRRFEQTLEGLKANAVEGLYTIESLDSAGAYHARDRHLAHLCQTLMHAHAQRLDISGQIDREKRAGLFMIEAPDAAAEVGAVLRRVKRLLLDGVSPDHIMISLRDWERYQPQFVSMGRAYQIPLVLHYGDRLSDVPIITTLMKLLHLHAEDFPRRELLDALRSPYLKIPGLDAVRVGLIERISQQQIILGGRENWLDGIERVGRVLRAGTDEEEEDASGGTSVLLTAEEANQLAFDLNEFFEHITPPAQASLDQYIQWLEGLIGGDPLDTPDDDEGDFSLWGESYHFAMIACARDADERVAARDLTALQTLKLTLRSLMEARQLLLNLSSGAGAQPRTLAWDDFYTQLISAIDAAEINPHPSRSGRVLVTTAVNGRGLPHQHVMILGLSEGLFPRPAPQDPFYLDSERRSLSERGVELTSASERANDDGVFLELIALPTHSLTLTRPTAQDGQPWAESHLWRAVRDTFDGLPVERIKAGDVVTVQDAASLSEVALAVADALNTPDESPIAPDDQTGTYHRWLMEQQSAFWEYIQHNSRIEADRVSEEVPHDPHTGHIRSPEIVADIASQLASSRIWSASQWNAYGVCPYHFFAERLLKLEKLKPAEEGMDVLQRGSLYHEILQRTYQTAIDEGLTISPENQDFMLDVLRDNTLRVCRTAPHLYGFRPTALWAQEQTTLLRRLERLVIKDFSSEHVLHKQFPQLERRPYLVEAPFGFATSDDNTHPPVPVEIDLGEHGKVRLRGMIDRIDLVGDQLYIFDYKSGSTSFSVPDMRSGRNFQMVIYLLAAEAILAQIQQTEGIQRSPRAVAGGGFWHLSSNKLTGRLELPKDNDVIADAVEKIRDFLPAMRSGQFVVDASGTKPGEACTSYCDFDELCRLCRLGITKQIENRV